ncbi:MAG: peptidoglycan-binding protein [Micrococcales bacterium]|nr:peptidoglycan-binding protein [Micrococcales bacterium]
MSGDGTLGKRRRAGRVVRSRWLWAWLVCCVVVAGVAFGAGTLVRSSRTQAIANAGAHLTVTAEVQTRTLVLDSGQAIGTVVAGQRIDVVALGDGPQVVTATMVSPGDQMTPGAVVAEVSGRPIIVLDLPFPLYRDLVSGCQGRDVSAVQTALKAIGTYRGTVTGTYDADTAQAVQTLYRRTHTTPPTPPADAVAAVGTAQDGVAAAQRQLDAANATPDGASPDAAAIATATSELTRARADLTAAQAMALTPLPRAEVTSIPAGARVVSVAAVGTQIGAGDGSAAVSLVTGTPMTTVRVGVANVALFAVDAQVTVTVITDSAVTGTGTVVAVSEFRSSGSDDGGPPGYDVTITFADSQAGPGFADGTRVTVEPDGAAPLVTGTTVPVKALRSDRGVVYVLLVADGTADGTRRVDIEVVASADGYAVVTGDVTDGDRVLVTRP